MSSQQSPLQTRPWHWAVAYINDDTRFNLFTFAIVSWILFSYVALGIVVLFAPLWIPALVLEYIYG